MQKHTGQIKVLIADRDENSRSALKLLLVNEYSNIVITEAENIPCVESLAEHNKVNLAIIDWEFDNQHTKSFINYLRQSQPDIVVLVLGQHLEDKTTVLDAGAQAFIYKGDSPDSLYQALLTYLNSGSTQNNTNPPEHTPRVPRMHWCQLV